MPVGCLLVLLALAGFAAAIVGIASLSIRSSDVYEDAVARASAHPVVVTTLGPPIEGGWLVSGSIRMSGPSGTADLEIPLSGSIREAKLYAVATKSAGRWTFSTLEVEVEGMPSRILLLPAAPP